MEEARSKITGHLVEAEELPLMLITNKNAFECPDDNCKKQYTACSYLITNVIRPYFRSTINGEEHSDNCVYKKEAYWKTAGKKKRIEVEGLFPLPYPSKLVLIDDTNEFQM